MMWLMVLCSRLSAVAAERVDLGDGWYSFSEPEEEFETEFQEGPIVWRYDGMEVFRDASLGVSSGYPYNTADVPALLGDAEAMAWDSVMVDDVGRRWVAWDVDSDGITEASDEMALIGWEELGVPADTQAEPESDIEAPTGDPDGGELYWVTPHDWRFQAYFCGGAMDRASYGADDLTPSSIPMTEDQRKSVRVLKKGSNGTASCSGTLIDRRWVLTAAHCLADDPDAPTSRVPSNTVAVCSFGNMLSGSECVLAARTYLGPNYLSDPGPATDVGLIKLTYELNPATDLGFRVISTAGDAVVRDNHIRVTGYPGFVPSGLSHCANNSFWNGVATSVKWRDDEDATDWNPGGSFGYEDTDEVAYVDGSLIRSSMDLGSGFSGAGFWYENAEGADYLVGVFSSTVGAWVDDSRVDGAQVGVKASIFRGWVASIVAGSP